MAQTKKLSVATVYGKIDAKKVLNSEKPIKVMRVIGQAIGTKAGNSSYGDWTSLVGQFKAINADTGEVSEAATLFLPDVALIPLQVALARDDTKGVAFAIDIFVKASTNTKPGGSVYEYSFENVLPPADNDPIKALEDKIAALALPAPTTTPDPAPAPAPTPTLAPAKGGKGSK
jgi:hypothetical protein